VVFSKPVPGLFGFIIMVYPSNGVLDGVIEVGMEVVGVVTVLVNGPETFLGGGSSDESEISAET